MAPGAVRVFPLDLDPPADVARRLVELLPAGERDAPAPIRIARATTRLLLAETLGVEPHRVVISRVCARCGHPTHGRPTVAGTGAAAVSFSVSHSGTFGVVALAAGDRRIGVDVEAVRPRSRLDALADRVLGAEEHAAWRALDDPDVRLRAFLRAWTAKEAYLKALGIGITTLLRDVPMRVDGWTTRALDLGPACVSVLAVDTTGIDVTFGVAPVLATTNGGTAR